MKFRLPTLLAAALAGTGLPLAVLAPAHAAAGDPVTNVQITQTQVGTQDSVGVSWTPNDTDTAYRVYITADASGTADGGPTTDKTGTSTSLLASGLAGGGTYYVVVKSLQPTDSTKVITSFSAITLDTEAPEGSYTLNRTTAYLAPDFTTEDDEFADVKITQTGLSDNTTAASAISRVVNAGDGSASVSWTSTGAYTLRYDHAGTFHPTVTLKDEFGNSHAVQLPTVSIREDRTAPKIAITNPGSTKVAAWRHIHGTASDTETGVQFVAAFVAQKRGGVWYTYDFRKHKWLKGYSNLNKTLRKSKARAAQMTPSAAGAWQTPVLKGLRKGKLHVEAVAIDNNFNFAPARNVNVTLR